jgi:hypothetical protein
VQILCANFGQLVPKLQSLPSISGETLFTTNGEPFCALRAQRTAAHACFAKTSQPASGSDLVRRMLIICELLFAFLFVGQPAIAQTGAATEEALGSRILWERVLFQSIFVMSASTLAIKESKSFSLRRTPSSKYTR